MIKFNKRLKKSRIKYFTLNKFLKYIKEKNYKVRFYKIYYNLKNCMLILESLRIKNEKIRVEFHIELLIDETIYEWEINEGDLR